MYTSTKYICYTYSVFCREILHNGQWNIRSYSITKHLYISQITVGKFLHTILLALTVAKNIPLAYVYRRTCECHSYKMGNNWQYWQLYFAYAIMINNWCLIDWCGHRYYHYLYQRHCLSSHNQGELSVCFILHKNCTHSSEGIFPAPMSNATDGDAIRFNRG